MAELIFSQIGDVITTELNTVKTNLQNQLNTVTSGAGIGFSYHEVTEDITLIAANAYAVATKLAAITLTLPISPLVGDQVKIFDIDAYASTNSITISRNGSNIMGFAEDMSISTDNINIILVYINVSRGWIIG